jgi:hypothetical protein
MRERGALIRKTVQSTVSRRRHQIAQSRPGTRGCRPKPNTPVTKGKLRRGYFAEWAKGEEKDPRIEASGTTHAPETATISYRQTEKRNPQGVSDRLGTSG